jgi:hypothetical protein
LGRRRYTESLLFPIGERGQFVENFAQSLKPPFVIPGCVEFVPAAVHELTVGFADFCYLVTQPGDAFFDGRLHNEGPMSSDC